MTEGVSHVHGAAETVGECVDEGRKQKMQTKTKLE